MASVTLTLRVVKEDEFGFGNGFITTGPDLHASSLRVKRGAPLLPKIKGSPPQLNKIAVS